MEATPDKSKVLPDNAFRELEPGEVYQPVTPAEESPPEVTVRSVVTALLLVALFTFAAAYIGIKTGNVIETSIPIAILAVFLSTTLFRWMTGRRNTLLENVIIQSIGQASGVVVAGAIFTIPALYVLKLETSFLQIFLSCMLGGFLGVVLLIPLRRYFCKDLHGQLPFPEATAITSVLATGERSKGASGKVMLWAFALGFVYDLIVEFLHLWNHHLNSKVLFGKFGRFLEEQRFELRLNATAVYFGLGYIIGPRYAGVIAAGSVLSFLILVPLIYFAGKGMMVPLTPPQIDVLVRDMAAQDIFNNYVRPMGIGCIAVAGMIGIVKMGKIIVSSITLAFKGLVSRGEGSTIVRTDHDMKPRSTFLIQVASVFAMLLLFRYISGQWTTALVGTVITFVLAFLFTPVAARAIAIVGVNPVSGMTLLTLIIACVALAATGLKGDALGMSVALVIGCAVCTALSTSGAFITDLKTGYWLGASPFQQERWKFLGIVVASLCVGGVIWVLANSYGFLIINDMGQEVVNPDFPAPQGNLMAAIVQGLMGGEEQALMLYALGGVVAVLLEMARVPALAFGLGMYLPIEINMALFAGAGVGYVISRSGKDKTEQEARKQQGPLIASGLMAGAAIVGTIGAVLLLEGIGEPMKLIDLVHQSELGTGGFANWYENSLASQLISSLGLLGLAGLCYFLAKVGAHWQIEEEASAED